MVIDYHFLFDMMMAVMMAVGGGRGLVVDVVFVVVVVVALWSSRSGKSGLIKTRLPRPRPY